VYELESPRSSPNPTTTGVRDRRPAAAAASADSADSPSSIPNNIVFKENPGGGASA
jgi:hypothetical protein